MVRTEEDDGLDIREKIMLRETMKCNFSRTLRDASHLTIIVLI